MKISTTALWHNKKILVWLPKFGTTPSSVWVEWGAWLLEIVVRCRTQRAVDFATRCPKCNAVAGWHHEACEDYTPEPQSH